uniref:Uncharacterized protein n=1 Tax=Cacopsylla melanoneura TaxID=428564 RepID=A0A8D9FHC1_9HEMI
MYFPKQQHNNQLFLTVRNHHNYLHDSYNKILFTIMQILFQRLVPISATFAKIGITYPSPSNSLFQYEVNKRAYLNLSGISTGLIVGALFKSAVISDGDKVFSCTE